MIDYATIQKILDRADIVDVVSDFVSLRKHGQNFIGLCPFHDDTRPSFTVSPQKNICKCFACGEGGTPLNFIIKHEGLSYVEALKYLARKYNIEIEECELTEEEKQKKNDRELLFNANNFAQKAFQEALSNSGEGRLYGLTYFKERQINAQTIEQFGLGYSPSRNDYLSTKAREAGVDLKPLADAGLLILRDDGSYVDRYRERVIFPIHSISGNIVGFGGRIMKNADKLAKYINSPESIIYNKRRELYGLYFAKQHIARQDKCLIVEGYMDVLSMHQKGVKHVVASSGTALTKEQVALIRRFTRNVTLIFDSDVAGLKAALRGIDLLLAGDMNVKIVTLPEGHDPDSYAKEHSLEAINDYIAQHEEDFIRYKIKMLGGDIKDNPHNKANVIADILGSISFINDELVRDVYARDASDLLDVTLSTVFTHIEHLRKDRQEQDRRERERARERQRQIEAEGSPIDQLSPTASATPPTPTTPTPSETEDSRTSITGVAQSRETPPPLKKKMVRPSERYITLYILKYGNRVIPEYTEGEVDEETGDPLPPFTIIDILADQTKDLMELNFLSPVMTRMIDECVSLRQELGDAFNPLRYLADHPDDEIRELANSCISEQQTLSRLHHDFEEESATNDKIFYYLMSDIVALKNEYLEETIASELQKLRTLTQGNTERGEEVLACINTLQQLNMQKRSLAERLGDRVMTPKNRLL